MLKFLLVALFSAAATCGYCQDPAICKQLISQKDGGVVSVITPGNGLKIGKVTTPTDTTFYLFLKTGGSTIVTDGKGVKVLLDGGRVIEDEAAAVKPTGKKNASGQYEYEAMFKIEKVNLVYLALYKVAGFSTYVFDGALSDPEAVRVQRFAECMF